MLERIRPHLVRAARIQGRFEALRREAALGGDFVDALPACFVAADAKSRAVRMNQAAEAVLRRGDVMQIVSGRLVAPVQAQTAALHHLIWPAQTPPCVASPLFS